MPTQKIVISSSYQDTRIADEALRSALVAVQIPEEIISSCELALHELLINLVDHAYGGDQTQSITVWLGIKSGTLKIQTFDTGKSANLDLDAISMPDPDGLAEGGYGLAIIQSLVDTLEYQRTGDRNIWTLRKKVI